MKLTTTAIQFYSERRPHINYVKTMPTEGHGYWWQLFQLANAYLHTHYTILNWISSFVCMLLHVRGHQRVLAWPWRPEVSAGDHPLPRSRFMNWGTDPQSNTDLPRMASPASQLGLRTLPLDTETTGHWHDHTYYLAHLRILSSGESDFWPHASQQFNLIFKMCPR